MMQKKIQSKSISTINYYLSLDNLLHFDYTPSFESGSRKNEAPKMQSLLNLIKNDLFMISIITGSNLISFKNK